MTEEITRLNIRSTRDLAFRLGISAETIMDIAAQAGRHYHPLIKRQKNKERLIDNPTGPVRALQDRIQERLLSPLILPDYIHGGVPGRSPVSNAAAHLGQRVVVGADVKDFFPSVTHRQIFDVWWKTLGCVPTIARLLTQLTSFKRHLPQGAPTSTTLANLVLHEAGVEVRRACAALGLAHTTFVDDLTFSGEKAREVLGVAAETLRKAGFRLPHRKIKIMGPRVQKKVTGAVLGAKLNVPKDKKSKVRAALHCLSIAQPGSKEWETARRSTIGLIAHVASIDKKLADTFRRQSQAIEKGRRTTPHSQP